MCFPFHLPRFRVQMCCFSDLLAIRSLSLGLTTSFLSSTAATSHHRSVELLLSFMVLAEDFLGHLPSNEVFFGSDEVCRMHSRWFPGKNKNIFRWAEIELRFEIRGHLLLSIFCGGVAVSEIGDLIEMFRGRCGCYNVNMVVWFVDGFVESEWESSVLWGYVDFLHECGRLSIN